LRRLRPELWRQKNWQLHHDNAQTHTSFFTKEFFGQKQHDLPYFSLFPRLQIKLKGRYFDTTEVIEAKSQAVLNTLTEHSFEGDGDQ
jgi:hypothetical protein